MGAATSMPTIFIVSPALVEPLAEDQLAGFVQHQQLVVVLLDGDVELLLGVHVVAFPQGVVLGPALLRHLLKHWSMCVCVCVRAAKSWVHVQTHVVPKGLGSSIWTQALLWCCMVYWWQYLCPPFWLLHDSARLGHSHAQYKHYGYICVKP